MGIYKIIEKKRKEEQRRKTIKVAKTITAATTAGAVLGATAGIFLAPKSGKESREDLKNKTCDVSEKVKIKGVELKENFNNKVVGGKDNVKEAKEKIKNYLSEKKNVKQCEEAADEISETVETVEDNKAEEPCI